MNRTAAHTAIPAAFSSLEEHQRCAAIAEAYLQAIRLDLAPDEPSFVAPHLSAGVLP